MDASAEGSEHADAPVPDLVQVALDDDRFVAGNFPGGIGLVVQVLDEVGGGALIEPVRLQPRQRLRFRGPGQLAGEAPDVHPELQGAAGPVAVPEGHLPRLAGRGSDDHLVLGDLLDPPAGSAEDEDVALARLEDHLFVQLAYAPLLSAPAFPGLQEHPIKSAVRDGSGVRDRHARGSLARPQRARHPVPGEARTQLGELVRWISAREHVQHPLERAAGEIREGRRAPHQLIHLVGLVHAVRRVRDDLLGEHVERVAGIERLLHLTRGHSPSGRRGAEQVTAVLGKDDAFGDAAHLVCRAADPLQAGGDGRRSLDLDHEVYRAHVDPELERGSGDDGAERAALEPILHLLALVARD